VILCVEEGNPIGGICLLTTATSTVPINFIETTSQLLAEQHGGLLAIRRDLMAELESDFEEAGECGVVLQ